MGAQSVYVFPFHEEEGFCERAIEKLSAAGIIKAGNRRAENGAKYGAGPNADTLLPDRFEYLGLRIGARPQLIPEDPIEPRCPACGADISEAFYDTVSDELDRDRYQDWSAVTVRCSECAWSGPLTGVDDDVGVYARREFFFFDETQLWDDAQVTALRTGLQALLGEVAVKVYAYT